jgi:transcription initiation factor TFIIE subunit alpha
LCWKLFVFCFSRSSEVGTENRVSPKTNKSLNVEIASLRHARRAFVASLGARGMSEHKKLARLAIRAFYRHSSSKERLARTGNAKYDNSRIAEVLVDALTRRTWVKEDDLANAVLLSAKQVRKALLYLEEQRLVTRAHVKEKDKDREARTRARAEENNVDEHIIMERIRAIDKKIVTYVCLNYSRVYDALALRIGTARKELKHLAEKGPVSVLFKCVNDPEICGKRYSSLDAARLMDPTTMSFKCAVCAAEVIQCGGGEDGSAPEPRTREAMRAALAKFETQVDRIQKQLDKVKGSVPPQYGTLNEYTRARKRAAAASGGGGGGGGFGARGGGLNVQIDSLEDTTFEVTLGLTEEQEAAREAELHAPKMQPEWVTKNQFAAEDAAAAAGAGAGVGAVAEGASAADAAAKAEEKIKEEWLRAYLGALKGASGTAGELVDDAKASAGDEKRPEAMATDDLVAEAMAGGDEAWEDVEDDWEDA